MDQIIKDTLHLCPTLTIAQVRQFISLYFSQVRVTTDNGDLLSVYPDKNDIPSIKIERKNE